MAQRDSITAWVAVALGLGVLSGLVAGLLLGVAKGLMVGAAALFVAGGVEAILILGSGSVDE